MLFGVRGLASSRGGERRECRRLLCSDVTSGRHHFGAAAFAGKGGSTAARSAAG
jgi:hypothetical protein